VSYRLVIRPEAEADLTEAFQWYETRRAGLGGEFLQEVGVRLSSVTQNPTRLGVVFKNVRQILVRRFPYKIL
jgi:hypothetical protein